MRCLPLVLKFLVANLVSTRDKGDLYGTGDDVEGVVRLCWSAKGQDKLSELKLPRLQ